MNIENLSGVRGLGPSHNELWARLAFALGGTHKPGDFWQAECVAVTMGSGYTVTLDQPFLPFESGPQVACTRLHAVYQSTHILHFVVATTHHRHTTNRPVYPTGHLAFDRLFYVLAGDGQATRFFASNPQICEYLIEEPSCRVEVIPRSLAHPVTGTFQSFLEIVVPAVIEEETRLLLLFEMMAEMIEQLCAPPPSDAPTLRAAWGQ